MGQFATVRRRSKFGGFSTLSKVLLCVVRQHSAELKSMCILYCHKRVYFESQCSCCGYYFICSCWKSILKLLGFKVVFQETIENSGDTFAMNNLPSENTGHKRKTTLDQAEFIASGTAAAGKRSHPGSPKSPEKMSEGASGAFKEVVHTSPTLPSDEEFNQIAADMAGKESKTNAEGSSATYAGKAKKVKQDYPFALYVLAESENLAENLSKKHYAAFEEFIWHARLKLSLVQNKKLLIDWMIYRDNSYGLIACADRDTAVWVKTQANAFKYEGKSTRPLFRWEQEDTWIFSMFLTGDYFKKKECKPNWITGQIFALNGLDGQFRNATLDKKTNQDGAYLSFEPVGKKLTDQLASMSILECNLCRPELQRRLRKQRSESEFLEQFRKDLKK